MRRSICAAQSAIERTDDGKKSASSKRVPQRNNNNNNKKSTEYEQIYYDSFSFLRSVAIWYYTFFSIASDQKPFCFHQTNTVAEAAVYKEQGKRVEVEKKLVR